MAKNENYDDVKELFSGDISLPESLSKEKIVQKIKDSAVTPEKKKNVRVFPRVLAAAAAFAVVAVGAVEGYRMSLNTQRPVRYNPAVLQEEIRQETAPAQNAAPAQTAEKAYKELNVGTKKISLSKFKSEKDAENYRKNALAEFSKQRYDNILEYGVFETAKSAAAADMAAPTMAATGTNGNAETGKLELSEFGKTNVQVDGVDEADIVKTDGNFLYIISNNTLSIIDAGTMKLMSQTELKASGKKKSAYISDMYLSGNRLVVTGYETENNDDFSAKDSMYSYSCVHFLVSDSFSAVFDITERGSIKELRRVKQDGNIVASRMIGSYLYTVTSYSPDYKKDTAFYAKINDEKLTCDDIYIDKSKKNASTSTVISCYDTADENSKISKKSVIAEGNTVYCSSNTLYIACPNYSEKQTATEIHAFSLKSGEIAYKGSTSVPGTCSGQYMMDQSGKYFRIATTDYNYRTDHDVSSLYVIDENMKVIGKLENIAHDEQIKSVRFMGNTAYVVTFKNTDPLFAIDLSRPNKPEILGEVKLPGFSSYLHPLSENLLIGIGYDGDEENADFSKVKISLFDVSNKKKPKEITSHVMKNAECRVDSNDAKAFLMIDENTFGIPVAYYNGSNTKLVFKTFTVENNKFTEKNVYVHSSKEDYSNVFRGTFIGSFVYTISDTTVKQFDMKSEKELSSLTYYERKETPEVENNPDSDATVAAYTATTKAGTRTQTTLAS